MCLNETQQLVHGGECQACDSVGAAIVYADAACRGIRQRRAGRRWAHRPPARKAPPAPSGTRSRGAAPSRAHPGRAGLQPPGRQNRCSWSARRDESASHPSSVSMGVGPGPPSGGSASRPLCRERVAPPIGQVRAAAEVDVAKGMPGIQRAAEHHVLTVYFCGKEYAVAVVGQKDVFQLVEGDKVLRPAQTIVGPW